MVLQALRVIRGQRDPEEEQLDLQVLQVHKACRELQEQRGQEQLVRLAILALQDQEVAQRDQPVQQVLLVFRVILGLKGTPVHREYLGRKVRRVFPALRALPDPRVLVLPDPQDRQDQLVLLVYKGY